MWRAWGPLKVFGGTFRFSDCWLDILVHAEEILQVPLVLDFDKTVPDFGLVSCGNSVGFVFWHEVKVDSPGGIFPSLQNSRLAVPIPPEPTLSTSDIHPCYTRKRGDCVTVHRNPVGGGPGGTRINHYPGPRAGVTISGLRREKCQKP